MDVQTPDPLPKVRADHLQRAEVAWRMRVLGATWKQAAAEAGYADDTAAMKAVRTAFGTVPRVERDELRRLWRDRLESLWRQALLDASEQRAGAVTAGVRVVTAAASLDGLNEPVRTTVDVAIFERIEMELVELGL